VKRTLAFFILTLFAGSFAARAAIPAWNHEILFVNFKKDQERKVHEALTIIQKIVATDEFKNRILNHTFEGKKTFVDSNDLSNAEIYRKILTGTMKVELELYHSPNTTIGYTYPDTKRIWINTKYFNRYTPVKVADNLMHEWMHKLGFNHAVKHSATRNYSVPYAVGYLIEELAAKYK
jgi:hypothetical protein